MFFLRLALLSLLLQAWHATAQNLHKSCTQPILKEWTTAGKVRKLTAAEEVKDPAQKIRQAFKEAKQMTEYAYRVHSAYMKSPGPAPGNFDHTRHHYMLHDMFRIPASREEVDKMNKRFEGYLKRLLDYFNTMDDPKAKLMVCGDQYLERKTTVLKDKKGEPVKGKDGKPRESWYLKSMLATTHIIPSPADAFTYMNPKKIPMDTVWPDGHAPCQGNLMFALGTKYMVLCSGSLQDSQPNSIGKEAKKDHSATKAEERYLDTWGKTYLSSHVLSSLFNLLFDFSDKKLPNRPGEYADGYFGAKMLTMSSPDKGRRNADNYVMIIVANYMRRNAWGGMSNGLAMDEKTYMEESKDPKAAKKRYQSNLEERLKFEEEQARRSMKSDDKKSDDKKEDDKKSDSKQGSDKKGDDKKSDDKKSKGTD